MTGTELKNHELLINDLVSRLMVLKVNFTKGKEEHIDEYTIQLPYEYKKNVPLENLISNQLAVLGLEWSYLPFSEECITWLLSGRNSFNLWHIVLSKDSKKITFQWRKSYP